MSNWKYSEPDFECDFYNKELLVNSPWSGHRNFAYDLITFYQPQTIVELGSYYGCSSFAFLQAVKDKNLDSEFYAIDTWGGDTFTENDYKEDIYKHFKNICDQCYVTTNVTMLRMTFDQAVDKFDDESIDILHIDGSHTYEDVKHDFLTWKNKVKQDGIILFHDVSEDKLFGKVMGSHLFWKEIVDDYPFTLEFDHSFGLGILFKSEERYVEFENLVSMQHYQRLNNEMDVNRKDELRKNYFTLLEQNKYIEDLKNQCKILNMHLEKYHIDVQAKDDYINELEFQKKEVLNTIEDYQKSVDGKDSYIRELEHDKKLLDSIVMKYEENVKGKDSYINELIENNEKLNVIIRDYEKNVDGKDIYIKELLENIRSLQTIIKDYETNVIGKNSYISELLETNEKLNEIIKEYEINVTGKDAYINELMEENQHLHNLNDTKRE